MRIPQPRFSRLKPGKSSSALCGAGPGCRVWGSAQKNVVPSNLKIRQTTTWGIKMLESNFYSGLVTEAAVVTAVQFSAQNAGCGSSGQPRRQGRLCRPHGACRLAAGGARSGRTWWKRAPGAPTAAAFRTRGGAVSPPGGRALPSPAECGILGLREPGPATRAAG